MLNASIGEVLRTFASIDTPIVLQVLIQTTLPTLSQSIQDLLHDPFSPTASSAVDLVDSVFSGRPSPLGQGLFDAIAGTLFRVMEKTEDRDVVQAELGVIESVVRKDVDQLLQWSVSDDSKLLSRIFTKRIVLS